MRIFLLPLQKIVIMKRSYANALLYLVLGAVYFISFYPIIGIGFANEDDFAQYILSFNLDKVFESSVDYAEHQGRVFAVVVMGFHYVAHLFKSEIFYSLSLIITILVSISLYLLLIYKLFKNKTFVLLLALIFPACMQIFGSFCLFISYPFFFSFSLSILIFSYLLLLKFFDKRKSRYLWGASLLFLFTAMFYEIYLLFIIFYFLIIYKYESETTYDSIKKKWLNCLKVALPFIVMAIIFIVIYFTYKMFHQTEYSGTAFAGDMTFYNTFKVILSVSTFAFPMTVYVHYQDLLILKSMLANGHYDNIFYAIINAGPTAILKGILVASVFCVILKDTKVRLSNFTIFKIIVLGFVIILLPNVLFGVTEKNQNSDWLGYVTTFYSYFGVVLSIASFLLLIYKLVQNNSYLKWFVIAVSTVSMFSITTLTQMTNQAVVDDVNISQMRFKVMDEIMETDFFKNIPDNSIVYLNGFDLTMSMKSPWVTHGLKQFRLYIEKKSGKTINYLDDSYGAFYKKFQNHQDTVCYLINIRQSYKREEAIVYMTKLDKSDIKEDINAIIVDEVVVGYYSSVKRFTAVYSSLQDGYKLYKSMNIVSENLHDPMTIFILKLPDIIPNSIVISDIMNEKYSEESIN